MRHRSASALMVTLLLVAATLGAASPTRGEARGLALGLTDGVYGASAAERDPWLERTVSSGASIVRLDVSWAGTAPRDPPPGFNAADPGDPAYDFAGIDAGVRGARARGLQVLMSFGGAPAWAEGARRPRSATPGSWRPDPSALGRFAEALARRYSGSYPDPLFPGKTLPRVRYFQVWNEANLSAYLAPQWVRRGKGYLAEGPRHYREMLNASYRAIKRAQPGAVVVSTGTAPFGDPDGGSRMQPARFVRELLCLRGRRLLPLQCPDPAHFDVLDHHPYDFGSPRTPAIGTDEVSVPDLGKLLRILRQAERAGRALPRGHKRLWVTEISWDSSPPDPHGIPEATHARWLEDALYILWKQGVDTVFWFQVRDQLPVPSYAATNQSGLYFRDGTPKLAQQAFKFPFVTRRARRGVVRAWGKAPVTGWVRIQRLFRGQWVTVRLLRVGSNRVFLTSLPLRGKATLRAVSGAFASLTWRAGA